MTILYILCGVMFGFFIGYGVGEASGKEQVHEEPRNTMSYCPHCGEAMHG